MGGEVGARDEDDIVRDFQNEDDNSDDMFNYNRLTEDVEDRELEELDLIRNLIKSSERQVLCDHEPSSSNAMNASGKIHNKNESGDKARNGLHCDKTATHQSNEHSFRPKPTIEINPVLKMFFKIFV